jgi:hypothetical protein
MRLTVFRCVVLVSIFFAGFGSSFANAQTVADRIVAGLKANTDTAWGAQKEKFVRTYVARLEQRFGSFETFPLLLEKKQEAACNILCEAHVLPAFRLDQHPTIVDLILYALSNTCYGVLPGEKHRNLALEDLISALKEAPLSGLVLNKGEWKTVREDLGDVLKQERTIDQKRWDVLREFWKGGHDKDRASNSNPPRVLFTETELAAATKACGVAGLWKP